MDAMPQTPREPLYNIKQEWRDTGTFWPLSVLRKQPWFTDEYFRENRRSLCTPFATKERGLLIDESVRAAVTWGVDLKHAFPNVFSFFVLLARATIHNLVKSGIGAW